MTNPSWAASYGLGYVTVLSHTRTIHHHAYQQRPFTRMANLSEQLYRLPKIGPDKT